jgi:hypothetical protein
VLLPDSADEREEILAEADFYQIQGLILQLTGLLEVIRVDII